MRIPRLIVAEDRLLPGNRELWFSFVILETIKVKVFRLREELR
jgi:hypothetical protein